jgi:small nuclear ribonucleoprotein (snRNP)-like protein
MNNNSKQDIKSAMTAAAASSTAQKIPVSLGKPSLRLRLEAYYLLIAPDQISDPTEWRTKYDQIYQKFGGTHEREQKLATKLAKKYGTAVRLLLAASVETKTHAQLQPAPSSTNDVSKQHDEEWYSLKPHQELNSGNLNFLSDCFDPEAALQASEHDIQKVNLWVSACPFLDTVSKFCFDLPRDDPLHREPIVRKRPPPSAASIEAANKKPKIPSQFTSVAENFQKGPLSLLYQLQSKRQRVRVVIRYVNGIRGTITGTLIAFDQHMNLILRDADEVYSPRNVTRDNDNEEPQSNMEMELQRRQQALLECSSSGKGTGKPVVTVEWRVRQRQLKQLLVRGDSVVLVYKPEEERSTWPKTSKSPKASRYKRPIETVPDQERVGSPGSLGYALQRKLQRDAARKKQR